MSAEKKKTEIKKKTSIIEKLERQCRGRFVPILLLIISAIIFFVNYNEVFDKKLDLNGDNIVYYSLGQSLHGGLGYTDVMSWEVKPHTHFPPGYPAFISVFLNFVREGNYLPIKKANGVLLFLSLTLLFFVMRKSMKSHNVLIAFSVVALCCVHKDLLRWSTIMMSEMLFLFLSMAVIALSILLKEKKSFRMYTIKDYAMLLGLMFSVAYVYFVRTMGISVILAAFGWFLCLASWSMYKYCKSKKDSSGTGREHRQNAAYHLCMALLVILPFLVAKTAWGARNKSIGHERTDYIGDFKKKGVNGEVMSEWSDWTKRVYNNAKSYLTKMMPETVLMKPFEKNDPISAYDIMVGLLVFGLVMIGLCNTGWGGFLIFCYLAVTFSVLLIWPEQFSSVRYYVAVVPFILFFFVNGIWNAACFVCRHFEIRGNENIGKLLPYVLTLSLVFIWLIPKHVEAQENFRRYAKSPYRKISADENFINFYEGLEWCKKNLPDSSRMVCRKPEIYYVFTDFKKCTRFPLYAEVDSVISFLDKKKATHVILDNWFKHAYHTVYPAVKKYPEKFKVLHKIAEVDTVKKINPVYILEYNSDWGYHGDLVDGKKEGKGEYHYQDGRKYVGEFADDEPNGIGVLYDEEGNEIRIKSVPQAKYLQKARCFQQTGSPAQGKESRSRSSVEDVSTLPEAMCFKRYNLSKWLVKNRSR